MTLRRRWCTYRCLFSLQRYQSSTTHQQENCCYSIQNGQICLFKVINSMAYFNRTNGYRHWQQHICLLLLRTSRRCLRQKTLNPITDPQPKPIRIDGFFSIAPRKTWINGYVVSLNDPPYLLPVYEKTGCLLKKCGTIRNKTGWV